MKVLLVVIDGATPSVVCPAVSTGRLPTLQRLLTAGQMHQASTAIFPSLTPAATASIITGAYPAEHGIVGASWYDEDSEQVVYFGDDVWIVAKEGFGPFLRDFLAGLNGDRLTALTMFEMVERAGRSAASLNYLVFRGGTQHRVRVPPLMKLIPRTRVPSSVRGPSVLRLGDFVPGPRRRRRRHRDKTGPFNRFGMDDAATRDLLCELTSQQALPDFTVAYFADNDYRSHGVGPHRALPVVERVDAALGAAFDAAGGLDRFLNQTCVVVTSDHGHCDVLDDARLAVVRLDERLSDFRQAKLGGRWGARDDVMICPNMRAAQVYVRNPSPRQMERVAAAALADPGVDQVIWRAALTDPGAPGYVVATANGRLVFRRDRATDSGRDAFGTHWVWRGEAAALDVARDGDAVVFGAYPNAFERVAHALDAKHSGEMWVTARPGREFEVPGGSAHVGGASHGALHALDSLCPVIVAGRVDGNMLRRDFRSVDIAPLCMAMLGLKMRYAVGDPRITK